MKTWREFHVNVKVHPHGHHCCKETSLAIIHCHITGEGEETMTIFHVWLVNELMSLIVNTHLETVLIYKSLLLLNQRYESVFSLNCHIKRYRAVKLQAIIIAQFDEALPHFCTLALRI